MRILGELPKSDTWISKGYVLEATLEQPLKVGSYHQLANDYVRVRAGGLPLEIEGRFVAVMAIDTWPLKDGGHQHRLKVVDIDLPVFLHKQSHRGYTHDRRAMMESEDEPPAQNIRDEFTAAANDRDQLRRHQSRAERLQEELAELEATHARFKRFAREAGVDARSDMRVVERRIDAVKRRIERAA